MSWPTTGTCTPGATPAQTGRDLATALETRTDVVVTALLEAGRLDLARRILGRRRRAADPTGDPGTVRIRVGYHHLDAVRQLLQFADHIKITTHPRPVPWSPPSLATSPNATTPRCCWAAVRVR